MMVVLRNHVGIVGLGERFHGFFDGGGVALVEQARVPVVGVDNGPVVGVVKVTSTVPAEALELLPVASGLFRRRFQIHFAKLHDVILQVLNLH
jgi:hypothetical protein